MEDFRLIDLEELDSVIDRIELITIKLTPLRVETLREELEKIVEEMKDWI